MLAIRSVSLGTAWAPLGIATASSRTVRSDHLVSDFNVPLNLLTHGTVPGLALTPRTPAARPARGPPGSYRAAAHGAPVLTPTGPASTLSLSKSERDWTGTEADAVGVRASKALVSVVRGAARCARPAVVRMPAAQTETLTTAGDGLSRGLGRTGRGHWADFGRLRPLYWGI